MFVSHCENCSVRHDQFSAMLMCSPRHRLRIDECGTCTTARLHQISSLPGPSVTCIYFALASSLYNQRCLRSVRREFYPSYLRGGVSRRNVLRQVLHLGSDHREVVEHCSIPKQNIHARRGGTQFDCIADSLSLPNCEPTTAQQHDDKTSPQSSLRGRVDPRSAARRRQWLNPLGTGRTGGEMEKWHQTQGRPTVVFNCGDPVQPEPPR